MKTLILNCQYDTGSNEVISLLNQMNLSAIEHLSIHNYVSGRNKELFKTISQFHTPVLRRLYFDPCDTYHGAVYENNFRKIVENCPNLRMVEFGHKFRDSANISDEFLLQIFEDRNIFVQFEDQKRQTKWENFLEPTIAYKRYQEMKINFLRCREIKVANDEKSL